MNDRKQWYAIYCHSQKEAYACHHLENQSFDAYLPRCRKMTRGTNGVIEKVVALFPRYLFVSFNSHKDDWRKINHTRGVIKLISSQNGTLQALPDKIITNLKLLENSEGLVSLGALELFKPGQRVRILSGTFKGCLAVYEKMSDKQRAEILINFLNTEVTMHVPAHALEKVD